MNDAVTTQIVTLYEESGGTLSPEEISEALDNTIGAAAIKLALMHSSKLYRKQAKELDGLFTTEDKEMAMMTLRSLCMTADSDAVRFRAANKIFDVATGRDQGDLAKSMTFNLSLINAHMQDAEEAIRRGKEKIIEIDPKHQHLKELENVSV